MVNNRVQFFTSEGKFLHQWGAPGYTRDGFDQPFGLALGEPGFVFVSQLRGYRLQLWTLDGTFVYGWGRGYCDGEFASPRGLAYVDGILYVADTASGRVQMFRMTYA